MKEVAKNRAIFSRVINEPNDDKNIQLSPQGQ